MKMSKNGSSLKLCLMLNFILECWFWNKLYKSLMLPHEYLHDLFLNSKTVITIEHCTVGFGRRIYRLHLCRGVRPPSECPGYNIKQSDGEVPVMLELSGMPNTPSLPLLPGTLRPGMVTIDRAFSMGQRKLNSVLMLN